MVKFNGIRLPRRAFLAIVTCLLFTRYGYASDNLIVTLSSNRVELGKPVQLTLSSPQINVPLDTLDLSLLLTDFHTREYNDTKILESGQQRHLVLYPRRTGSLVIPALNFLNTTTAEKIISVTPAIDSKNNTPIEISSYVSTYSPWNRQQVIVKLQFITRDAIVNFETPSAYIDNSDVVRLDIESSTQSQGGNVSTLHTRGWALFPRQAGKLQLNLPAIRLVRDGVTTHQFYPPLVNLDVKHLPVYVPATMPVGKLDLEINPLPTLPLLTGNLNTLRLVMTGHGINTTAMPSLNTLLSNINGINTYPAEVTTLRQFQQQGLSSRSEHQVNYTTRQQGFYDLGKITLNYFDPRTGTIETLVKPVGHILGIHTSLLAIIILLAIAISARFAFILFGWFKLKLQQLRYYRQAQEILRTTDNPSGLKKVMELIARAEGWPGNQTLRQWAQLCDSPGKTQVQTELESLERQLYKSEQTNLAPLKQQLELVCRQRWRLLNILTRG